MNLGFKPRYGTDSVPPANPEEKKEPETVYPSITLRGDAAKAFCDACKAGDKLTGTVKVRLVELTDGVKPRQEYSGGGGPRVELEIESFDFEGIGGKKKKTNDGESAEAAVDGYLNEKRSKTADDDEEMM